MRDYLLLLAFCIFQDAAPQGVNPPPGQAPSKPPVAPSGPMGPIPGGVNPARPVPQGPVELSKEVRFKLFVNSINEKTAANLIRSRFVGALDIKFFAAERALCVKFEGTYADLGRMEKVISDNLTPVTLVDPMRLIYSIAPAGDKADRKTVTMLLESLKGVKKANVNGTSAELFVEPNIDLPSIEEKAAQGFYRFKINSHELLDFTLDRIREGFSFQPLKEELLRISGVIEAKHQGDSIKVLALKGRVTKQALKPILRKHGAESK